MASWPSRDELTLKYGNWRLWRFTPLKQLTVALAAGHRYQNASPFARTRLQIERAADQITALLHADEAELSSAGQIGDVRGVESDAIIRDRKIDGVGREGQLDRS